MTATANNESSFAGKATVTPDMARTDNAHFPATASQTKDIVFKDPTKAHSVYISTAGQTDFVFKATSDSYDAISKGIAVWSAGGTYGARDGNLFLGDLPAGVTALRVTAARTAAQTDNAGEVTTIGSRCEVRCVEVPAVTSGETAAAGVTARTELAVD